MSIQGQGEAHLVLSRMHKINLYFSEDDAVLFMKKAFVIKIVQSLLEKGDITRIDILYDKEFLEFILEGMGDLVDAAKEMYAQARGDPLIYIFDLMGFLADKKIGLNYIETDIKEKIRILADKELWKSSLLLYL